MTTATRIFTLALFTVVMLVGCGGPASTGHKDDPTPGGAPTPTVDTMDGDYAKQAAQGAK